MLQLVPKRGSCSKSQDDVFPRARAGEVRAELQREVENPRNYVPRKRTFTKRCPGTLLMGLQLFQTWDGVVQWLEATAGTHAHKTKDGSQQPPTTASRFIQSEIRSVHPGCPSPSPHSRSARRETRNNGTDTDGELPPPADEKRSEQSEP